MYLQSAYQTLMKICLAQAKPVKGNVRANVDNHKSLIELAISHSSEVIIFPELSLTGYEPTLASELATNKDDERFKELQELSDSKKIIIGAGMPIKTDKGIMIGMIIFQPDQPRQTYFKQYIHADEEPYFINGIYRSVLSESKIAMAICYEISVPRHAEQAHKNGAKMYIASVAKTVAGVEKAIETLSGTAKKYSMTVLMSNCVGMNDGVECGGRTSAWNDQGILLEQLNDKDEGLLIFDTDNQGIIKVQKEFSFSK
jgi:predicted amidohydrolase